MSAKRDAHSAFLETMRKSAQIHNHPANTSPTKQQFSFSHAQRFFSKKQPFNCKAEFYDVNEKLFRSQKSCSLGKGNRYDISKNSKDAPPPNAYFPKYFNIESQKRRGFSFGLAREKCSNAGIAPYMKMNQGKPGPGEYYPKIIPHGREIKLHSRPMSLKKENLLVGPGKYNIQNSFAIPL